MRRVLVPLDGSELAASILPDALRLAGRGGTLILVRDAEHALYDSELGERSRRFALAQAQAYLERVASELRANGAKVEVHTLSLLNPVTAIQEATRLYHADMVAVATHGYGPVGRLIHNGMAWRVVSNSQVPVLLRHAQDRPLLSASDARVRRLMVPLDGSSYAENALPLARQLAAEWHASIWLVRCVPSIMVPETLPDFADESYPPDKREDMQVAREYLEEIAETLEGEVHTSVHYGQVGPTLTLFMRERNMTDIVVASHCRTGLSRALVGSVTDELVQQSHCPIVIIPSLACASIAQKEHGGNKVLEAAGTKE